MSQGARRAAGTSLRVPWQAVALGRSEREIEVQHKALIFLLVHHFTTVPFCNCSAALNLGLNLFLSTRVLLWAGFLGITEHSSRSAFTHTNNGSVKETFQAGTKIFALAREACSSSKQRD